MKSTSHFRVELKDYKPKKTKVLEQNEAVDENYLQIMVRNTRI